MTKVKTVLGQVGFRPCGEWEQRSYGRFALVSFAGSSFVSLIDANNAPLTDATKWMVVAGKGEKGDTPVFDDFTEVQKAQLKGDKGDSAKSPTVQTGTITTGDPGSEVTFTFTEVGTTEDGRPVWRADGSIPRGQKGESSEGSGNLLADVTGVKIGKMYLLSSISDGSAEVKLVEYVAPTPYDDAEVRRLIGGKVDVVAGKQLTTEDFTSLLKQKLEGLTNYDDSELTSGLNTLKSRLDTLIGTSVSDAIETFNEITSFLAGVTDTQSLTALLSDLRRDIVALIPTKTSLLTNDSNFVSDAGYVHTDNNYTTEEKNKLASLEEVTASKSGLMSAADKKRLDFEYGCNEVTTLRNLPVTKRTVCANLSEPSLLTLSADMEEGQEILIRCSPPGASAVFLQTTGAWTSMVGDTFYRTDGKVLEISVWCYKAGYYEVAIVEQD